MDAIVLFALVGTGAGAVYAAVGLGLVVTYKGTGIVNFALGAVGMWTAYVFDELRRTGDVVLPLAFVPHRIGTGGPVGVTGALLAALASAALLGLASHLLVFRPLRDAPVLAKVVASVGIMLTLQSLVVKNFGSSSRAVPPVLPRDAVRVAGQPVPQDRLWLAAIVIVLGALLWAYFRFTRSGLAMRAAAENERATVLARFSPQALAGLATIASSMVVGLVFVLGAPTLGLSPAGFLLTLAPGLACALAGRLTYIAPVVLTGLVLGVVQAEITHLRTRSWWPDWAATGLSDAVPFLAIVVLLVVVGRSLPARGAVRADPLPEVVPAPARVWDAAALAGLGVLLLLVTSGGYRFGVITSMIYALLALSLVVLTGLAGQISLAQAAFAGSAGFAVAKLSAHHLPFPLVLLAAALVAALLGLLTGLPAVRIRGTQLAVVTLALAIAMERFIFRNPSFVDPAGLTIPDPELFGFNLGISDGVQTARLGFGLVVLTVLTAVALAVRNLTRSVTGRRLLAMRSNERAAASVGINVAATKLFAFAVSSFIAGLGGALIGYSRGQLTAESFTVLTGIGVLAFAYLGGITSVSGAVIAGLSAPLGLVYVVLSRSFDSLAGIYPLLAAVSLVVAAIVNPVGLAGAGGVLLRRLVQRLRPAGPVPVAAGVGGPAPFDGRDDVEPAPTGIDPAPGTGTAPAGAATALDAEGLTVSYGGVLAVDGVDLSVRTGQIVGLIGPNGAGKTSVIDALTGFAPATGRITVNGTRVDALPAHRRARRGLGRTWQSTELFGDLSVRENLLVATQRFGALATVLDFVRPARRVRSGDVDRALRQAGLTDRTAVRPAALSLGEQKLLAVARTLATDATVLLLDEPAAGLDAGDSRRLGRQLRRLADEGSSILLVEHDVGLVLDICDYVYVLEFGRVIGRGTPSEIRADSAVVDAYLGSSARVSGVDG